MTEADWLSSTNPSSMMNFVRDKVSERKLRLFVYGGCRTVWNSLRQPVLWKAVEVAERYADGLADDRQLKAMRNAICPDPYSTKSLAAAAAFGTLISGRDLPVWSIDAATELACADAVREAMSRGQMHIPLDTKKVVRQSQASILRCIVGPFPFRTIVFHEDWVTTRVVDIAQVMYDERSYRDLPSLAGALEEASCTNEDILHHCLQHQEHARGCWVVDCILGEV